MRIIAGRYKGRVLKAPSASTTRPTTDRVKEALISSLYSLRGDFEGLEVLDAFAGSGALGLEMLSRGAGQVWFCEQDAAAARILRQNIASLPGAAAATVIKRGDVLKALPNPPRPFDVVFFDPPYAMDPALVADLIERLDAAGKLAPDAVIHYEHAKKAVLPVRAAVERLQWETVAEKTYGDIAFTILRKGNR